MYITKTVSHFLAKVFVYTNITFERSIITVLYFSFQLLKLQSIFCPIPLPRIEFSSVTNPSQLLTPH